MKHLLKFNEGLIEDAWFGLDPEIKEILQEYIDEYDLELIQCAPGLHNVEECGIFYSINVTRWINTKLPTGNSIVIDLFYTGDEFENKFLKFVCKIEEICKRLTEMTGYYATPSRNPYYNIYSEKKSYWSIRIDTKI